MATTRTPAVGVEDQETTMRDAILKIRALPKHWELIDDAASRAGKTREAFLFEAAHEKARTMLKMSSTSSQPVASDQVAFVLSEEKFHHFVQQIAEQPLRNPGLQRLQTLKACWDIK